MKKNDIIAITSYAKVIGTADEVVKVIDLDSGIEYTVTGDKLIDKMVSADFYHTEVTLPRTDIVSILVNAWNKPFTVEFTKKSGELRKLRGRLKSTEALLGRGMVEDLDKEGERTRLVDFRTISFLILEGVKYKVKA